MPAMEVARALGLVLADDGGDRSVKTSPGGAVKGVGGAWGAWRVQPCSALRKGEGLYDGLRWLWSRFTGPL